MTQFPLDIISININRGDVNYYITPHSHNFWQFYYVHSGDIEMTVGKFSCRLSQGDGMLIRPGIVRQPRCVGKAPVYTFVFFENASIDFEGVSETVLHANVQQQARFQEIFEEMELPKDRDAQTFMASSLISLLIELKRSSADKRELSRDHYLGIVSRLDTFMRSNIHLPITRKDLARVVHISQPHMARIFQKIMGMTPLERLTQLRVQHAQLLLSQSDQSITTISADVGYESISHFSRTFRKHTGKTPRDFRKDFIHEK